MSVTIHGYNEDTDLDHIVETDKEVFLDEAWTAEMFRVSRRAGAHVFVARDRYDGAFAGSAWLESNELINLAVPRRWQGVGVGRLLLEAAIQMARSIGHPQVMLDVAPNNTGPMQLYISRGFMPVAHRPDYYGPGKPSIRMALRLRRVPL